MAWTPDEAEAVARGLNARQIAVKAQVHAGGRGKAGGVQLAATADSVRMIAEGLLGRSLVTDQTGPKGYQVRRVYVEEAVKVERDIYVAAMVERQSGRLVLLGARDGGEDIEERAAKDPSLLEKLYLDHTPLPDADYAAFAERLDMSGALAVEAAAIFKGINEAIVALDASLIEITRWP